MTKDVIAEAEKLRRVPGIVFADGPAGRRARIAGTGIEVFEVIGEYLACGRDRTLLAKGFDWLTSEQLEAALNYYSAFPEEIDAWISDNGEESIDAFWREHPWSRPPWR